MRHGMANRKLGRKSAHRMAMFRNQLASLIDNERIVTTLPKAKELRPLIEKLITLGKNDSVHARRNAARMVQDETLVAKLFVTLGPRFAERPGGYTRIIKLGSRRGDAAEMAIIEFVGYELPTESKTKTPAPAAPTRSKKKTEEEAPEAEEKTEAAPAAEKKPAKKKAAAKKKKKKSEPAEKPARKKAAPSKKKSKK
ncbi:MAG TPA: 50S ribosomal protein L17 [Thermoanaerobaculia bacterium]|nr:50S ribosomal protein L17 [Thermoanaerobaculia bacterium]